MRKYVRIYRVHVMNNHFNRAPQCTAHEKELEKEKRKKTHMNTHEHHNTIPPTHNSLDKRIYIYTYAYQQPQWLRKYKIACSSFSKIVINNLDGIHVHVEYTQYTRMHK